MSQEYTRSANLHVQLIAQFQFLIFFFFLIQDMIHIADTKVARRYGDFFIRQIHKFEEVSVSCLMGHH